MNDEKDAVTQTWDDYKLRKGEVGKNEAMAFRAGFEAGWQARPAAEGEFCEDCGHRRMAHIQDQQDAGHDAYSCYFEDCNCPNFASPQQPDTSVAERAKEWLLAERITLCVRPNRFRSKR